MKLCTGPYFETIDKHSGAWYCPQVPTWSDMNLRRDPVKKIGHGPPHDMRGNLKMTCIGDNIGGAGGHGHVTTIALAGPARA